MPFLQAQCPLWSVQRDSSIHALHARLHARLHAPTGTGNRPDHSHLVPHIPHTGNAPLPLPLVPPLVLQQDPPPSLPSPLPLISAADMSSVFERILNSRPSPHHHHCLPHLTLTPASSQPSSLRAGPQLSHCKVHTPMHQHPHSLLSLQVGPSLLSLPLLPLSELPTEPTYINTV
jgi:hypothetical protein